MTDLFPIARLQIDSTGVRRVRSRYKCLYVHLTAYIQI